MTAAQHRKENGNRPPAGGKTYDDRKFRYLHPADQITMIMERIYRYGMTTTSGGNISVKDDDGSIWVSPSGIDKNSLTNRDIVHVHEDGRVEGLHKPSSEFPFHRAIYRIRPDIRAILHAHPPALVAFSTAGVIPATDVLPNTKIVCGEPGFADYAPPGSEELGAKIADRFAAGHNIVIMENHGTVTGADDLFQAFMQFETLDFTARIQIQAKALGSVHRIPDDKLDLTRTRKNELPEFTPGPPESTEKALRKEMCALIHRSYDQGLFTSTEGTFAVRLDPSRFLITPYGFDRKYLRPDDIVLIRSGKREEGKLPSRSVLLHERIFATRPQINAAIIAHPPNLMAFNVTRTDINTRIIPEAYILLRDIGRIPFSAPITDHDATCDAVSAASPIVAVENNGYLVTGGSLLEAFDRLEVAEYSAKAVLGAMQLGTVRVMEDAVIDSLIDAFALPRE